MANREPDYWTTETCEGCKGEGKFCALCGETPDHCKHVNEEDSDHDQWIECSACDGEGWIAVEYECPYRAHRRLIQEREPYGGYRS